MLSGKKISEPIYIIGDGEICKYKLNDAENYFEAYDIECYKAFDALFRPLILYKKDKYNRVGFSLVDTKTQYDLFIQEVKKYMNTYSISGKLDKFIEEIPTYPDC